MAAQSLGGRGREGVAAKVEEADAGTQYGTDHQVSIVGHEDQHEKKANKDLGHVE